MAALTRYEADVIADAIGNFYSPVNYPFLPEATTVGDWTISVGTVAMGEWEVRAQRGDTPPVEVDTCYSEEDAYRAYGEFIKSYRRSLQEHPQRDAVYLSFEWGNA